MTTKLALVTGATNGIGKEAARGLLEHGFDVFLAGRDAGKGQAALEELRAVRPGARLELLLADLSSPAEARRLARDVIGRCDRLDVLVNNAGAYFATRELTPDGFERTFALNHLGYQALSLALLGLLEKSAPSRIINVSSGAHSGGKVDFTDVGFERRAWGGGWLAYAQSKLMNILFTKELARRLEGKGVTVNCMHPGFVASGFGRNNQGMMGALISMSQVFARSPKKGAKTIVYLATSPEVAKVSGEYFVDEKARRPSAVAQDAELAKKLWDYSEGCLAEGSLAKAASAG